MADTIVSALSSASGRYIVTFPDLDAGLDQGVKALKNAGLNVILDRDSWGAGNMEDLVEGTALVLQCLGMALVEVKGDDLLNFMGGPLSPPLGIQPDRGCHLPWPGPNGARPGRERLSWGLQPAGVDGKYTGQGVGIAILDTGLDLNHPDFMGRGIHGRAHSFVKGLPVQDGNGHGTHCAGIAGGPYPYGVAPDATLFIARVLDDSGSGMESSVLAAMNWALWQGCAVIVLSLTEDPPVAFGGALETAASRALMRGSLVSAGAGNDSSRPGKVEAVRPPACFPSVMCAGAVQHDAGGYTLYPGSNGGKDPCGGQVDLVAPGVDIYSSDLNGYSVRSGTSMAVPFVAGMAALHAQTDPYYRSLGLWTRLTQTAKRLPDLDPRDAGVGLVQAP
jgi:subtilisin family serine protease